MKFLIVCLGENTDVLLTTPVARCIKQQLNFAEVHYLVLSDHKAILDANPYVDHVHLKSDSSLNIASLEEESFDHIIDLQNDTITRKISKQLKKPVVRVKKHAFREFLFETFGLNVIPKHEHIVHRYFDAVSKLGSRNDGKGLNYFIPPSEELKEWDVPASHHFGFVAITFARSGTKNQLSANKIQEICRTIDHPIALIGTRNDHAKAESIASFDPIKVYNACGKFSFHETADLIRKSKVVIAQNADLAQIAAAFNKPVIGVWGSSYPLPDRRPYYGIGSLLYNEVRSKNLNKIAIQQILQYVNLAAGS